MIHYDGFKCLELLFTEKEWGMKIFAVIMEQHCSAERVEIYILFKFTLVARTTPAFGIKIKTFFSFRVSIKKFFFVLSKGRKSLVTGLNRTQHDERSRNFRTSPH